MKTDKIEKIEVAKNNGNFYYTGILRPDPEDNDWILIKTLRGENLRFRKEQIMQRREVNDTKRDDRHGKFKGNKDV